MLAPHVFVQYFQEVTCWQEARHEAPIQRLRDVQNVTVTGHEWSNSLPNPRKQEPYDFNLRALIEQSWRALDRISIAEANMKKRIVYDSEIVGFAAMGTRQEPCECYFDRWERLREAEFLLVVILFGEGSSQAQDSLFLDVIPLQQHHSHDEKHRRSRRVLTISWVFSFSERASWCSVVHSDVNWPLLSACLHEASPCCQFFCTFLWSSDSVDVWTLH